MKEQKRKRILALLLSVCMVFSLMNTGVYDKTVFADEVEEGSGDESISSFAITTVTGSAITYYVGGTGADDANAGTDSSAPLATLEEAAARTKDPDRLVAYDDFGRESYIIIVQDAITVAAEASFGDGSVSINTTIMGSVTGSAIVLREEGYTGNLIKVPDNTTLKLGNMLATDDDDLIFDGNSGVVTSQAPIIKNEGYLLLYNGVTLQNNNNNTSNNGGAITTSRTMNMSGGTLYNNSSVHGGAVYNYNGGSFNISGGYVINNRASSNGGGIYNASGVTLNGGTISNNEGANGGGVYNSGGFYQDGGIITGNVALLGSGVYNASNMTLHNGEITENGLNEVNHKGGGIYKFFQYYINCLRR
jgi:hypothetical protein